MKVNSIQHQGILHFIIIIRVETAQIRIIKKNWFIRIKYRIQLIRFKMENINMNYHKIKFLRNLRRKSRDNWIILTTKVSTVVIIVGYQAIALSLAPIHYVLIAITILATQHVT